MIRSLAGDISLGKYTAPLVSTMRRYRKPPQAEREDFLKSNLQRARKRIKFQSLIHRKENSMTLRVAIVVETAETVADFLTA